MEVATSTASVRILLAGAPSSTVLDGTPDVCTAPPGPGFSASTPQAMTGVTSQTRSSCPIAQLSTSSRGGGIPTAATDNDSSDNRPAFPYNPEGGFYSARCERDQISFNGADQGAEDGRCELGGAPGLVAYDGAEGMKGLALNMAPVQGWLVPLGARQSSQMHLSDHLSDLGKPPARPMQKSFITDWVPPPPGTGRVGDGAEASWTEASCSASVLAKSNQRKVRKRYYSKIDTTYRGCTSIDR